MFSHHHYQHTKFSAVDRATLIAYNIYFIQFFESLSLSVLLTYLGRVNSTPWVKKKQDTKLLSITSPYIDRFSKFFHLYTR